MPVAVSLCQFVLAAVFAVAGPPSCSTAPRPGARRRLRRAGARAGAAGRRAAAARARHRGGAVRSRAARWAALAGLAPLLVFSAAIVRALARGSAPDCNCFGGLTQTEVGRGTLVRNPVLGAVAAFAAFGTGEAVGAAGWIGRAADHDGVAAIVIGALVAALLGLGWFCWALLRQNGRLLLQVEAQASELGSGATLPDLPALAVGEPAPDFVAETVDGDTVSLASLRGSGRPVALVFADTHCGACQEALAEAARSDPDRVTVAVVMRGDGALAASGPAPTACRSSSTTTATRCSTPSACGARPGRCCSTPTDASPGRCRWARTRRETRWRPPPAAPHRS